MRQAAGHLNGEGDHYAIYLKLAEIQRENETQFFTHLHSVIRESLPPSLSAFGRSTCETAVDFQYALVEWSQHSDRNLSLFLDALEMAPPNLVASLLGTLRAAFTLVINRPGAHFQAIVCGSLSLSQVALDNASRFESISDLVLVTELDNQERFERVRQVLCEVNLTPTKKGMQALLGKTGGDPYLINRVTEICVNKMKQSGWVRMTEKRVAEALSTFLEDPTHWAVSETLRQIEINPSLLSCALLLLECEDAPSAKLPIDSGESPTSLDLCSAFSRTGDRYKIKSPLWKSVLIHYLTPARVGGLYSIAGYWSMAIRYLGQAVCMGETVIKSELFTTTINAIHSSEDISQAFHYLGQGLRAAYPESDVHLYFQTDSALSLMFPTGGKKGTQPLIFLEGAHRPEIEALRGPEYSIVPINEETRLLFPLRIGLVGAHTVGLASFNRLVTSDSPYEQREERIQLSAFLRQAARALKAKGQFVDLLDTTTRHVDKLKTFNKILTSILHNRDLPEEVLLRSMLEGITHGYGLEFNRALLFMPNEGQNVLTGCLSIGHSTRQETEEEWENEPFNRETVEEWLKTLFSTQEEKAQRHRQLQEMVEQIQVEVTAVHDPLCRCYKSRQPLLSSKHSPLVGFTRLFYDIVKPSSDFALIPIGAGEQVSGVIYVDNKFTGQDITAESFELLQTFVSQTALILENARAFAAERRHTDALTSLLQAEDSVNNQITQSVESVLKEIVASAWQLFGADCVVLYPLCSTDLGGDHLVYDLDRIKYVGVFDKAAIGQPRSAGGMATWVIKEGISTVWDTETAVLPTDNTRVIDCEFIRQEKVRSFIGVRLGSEENPVGVMYLDWRTARKFSLELLSVVRIFANFASVAIPSARRYARVRTELERRTRELTDLGQVLKTSLEIRSEEDIVEAIKWALQTAKEHTNAPYLYLVRNEPYDRWHIFHLTPSDQLVIEEKERLMGNIFAEAKNKLLYLCGDETPNAAEMPFHEDSCCILEMPVLVTGNCLAVLRLETPEPGGLTVEHEAYLQHIVSRLAVTLEQIERTQALRRLLETSWKLTHEKNLSIVLDSLVKQAMAAMRTVSAITLFNRDKAGQLVLGEMAGVREKTAVTRYPPYKRTIIDHVWRLKEPIFAEVVSQDPLLNGPFVQREKILSTAAFPLQVNGDRVGCMFFNYRIHHVFDEGERSILSLFAQLAAVAIHQSNLNEELQNARARELLQRISKLSTGMIHDINSAVASIPDLTVEIETKMKENQDVSAPLADLRRNADKTGQLAARLRDLVIHQQFRPELIQLNALIRTAVADIQEQKPSHITIYFQDDEAAPEIWADQVLIVRLLHNLIDNAWEAIPPQRKGQIQISMETKPMQVHIHIKDNGRGILPENKVRIFDPDYTTKDEMSGIHGIGLYYCQEIVKEHRGELKLDSKVGEGTTFTIILPRIYSPIVEE